MIVSSKDKEVKPKKSIFLVGSGIGNQVQTIPAFHLAKKHYGDLVVVNVEPYNLEATKVLFHGLAEVYTKDQVNPRDFKLQIVNYFYLSVMRLLRRPFARGPIFNESEVEYNMKSTGLSYTEDDMSFTGDCLDYIEPKKIVDVIIHDGYNKKNTQPFANDKWLAKSYKHWSEVAKGLKDKGLTVGSIGSSDEYIEGTEDLTGLSLQDSIGVIKGARMVLSNDTGLPLPRIAWI